MRVYFLCGSSNSSGSSGSSGSKWGVLCGSGLRLREKRTVGQPRMSEKMPSD